MSRRARQRERERATQSYVAGWTSHVRSKGAPRLIHIPITLKARARNFYRRIGDRHRCGYTAIVPNRGLYESRVLGLDVEVDKDRLRFYAGTELLLESEEFIARIQAMAYDVQQRAEEDARLRKEAEQRQEEEERRREEAERRREEAEREVARLRAELERLKR
ncbi:MAG TPA: hypothetical protein VNO30_27030 [Kofleriaceae bacterium]|nr:hypothetical protein [Kofleriaceae bacterium]